MMKCSAAFKTVDKLKLAYRSILNSRQGKYITRIKPALDENGVTITINLGVEGNALNRQFLPLIGEVELTFTFEDENETVNEIMKELQNGKVEYIFGKLVQLSYPEPDGSGTKYDVMKVDDKLYLNDLTEKILYDLEHESFDELSKNQDNILDLDSAK